LEVWLPDGTTVTTHGSDAVDSGFEQGSDLPSAVLPTLPLAATSSLNPPLCVSNPLFFRVLYSFPREKQTRLSQVRDNIREATRQANDVLHQDGLAYSNDTKSVDLRVKCDGNGGVDVAGFDSGVPGDDDSFANVVQSAKDRGYNNSGVKYVIYFDSGRPDACGVGNVDDDDRRVPDNRHNNFTTPLYSVIYGQECWGNGRTPLHEMGHNMGAVQRSAPNNAEGFHCDDGRDIMCTTGPLTHCSSERFDCGENDYFDPKNPSTYLSQKWQVGWSGNASVSISDR